MTRDDTIYDLGEIGADHRKAVFGSSPTVSAPAAFRRERPGASVGVNPALAGSLSLFVPGLGQLIAGEIAWGLFYLCGSGFCASCVWALLATLDRLVPTLSVLNIPTASLGLALASFAFFFVILHLAAVLHAHAAAPGATERPAPHPIVAAIASFAVPGWGQILAGHLRRAVLFLSGVWILGSAWLLVTPRGVHTLTRLGFDLPAALRDGWGPIALLSAPVVLWIIAVYDGAAGAASARRG